MHAVVIERYGAPEVVRLATIPAPRVQSGEVLVRVAAASVNGIDLHVRSGALRIVSRGGLPRQLGIDFVGTIVARADDVDLDGMHIGETVWGTVSGRRGPRSMAELVSVAVTQISPAPRALRAEEAATLIAGGTTAYTALVTKARMQPGERVLVRGAAGGVGSVAVQLARARGAHVTALASASTAEFVRSLGADAVLDYRTTPLSEIGSYDVILDTQGSHLRELRRRLAPGGRMVTIAVDTKAPLRFVFALLASVVHGRRRIRFFSGRPTRRDFARLTTQVERGELRPVLDRVFAPSRTAHAHAALEKGGIHGKLVISMSDGGFGDAVESAR